MKVSVIMPSLNVAPYIEKCIYSVINQSLQDNRDYMCCGRLDRWNIGNIGEL